MVYLLNGPGSFWSLSDPPHVPLVPPQVDDVLDQEPDPNRQRFVLGGALQTFEVLIHTNLKGKKNEF